MISQPTRSVRANGITMTKYYIGCSFSHSLIANSIRVSKQELGTKWNTFQSLRRDDLTLSVTLRFLVSQCCCCLIHLLNENILMSKQDEKGIQGGYLHHILGRWGRDPWVVVEQQVVGEVIVEGAQQRARNCWENERFIRATFLKGPWFGSLALVN